MINEEKLAIAIKALQFYAFSSNDNQDKKTEVGYRNEFGCGCCAGTVLIDEMSDYDSSVVGQTARDALDKINSLYKIFFISY